MNIVPTPGGPSPRGAGAQRLRDAASPAPVRSTPGETPAEGIQDQAEISPEALELQGASGASNTAIAPERLRAVLSRISDGTYDREDVRAQVAARIARDLAID